MAKFMLIFNRYCAYLINTVLVAGLLGLVGIFVYGLIVFINS
jgi:hypothetical protein